MSDDSTLTVFQPDPAPMVVALRNLADLLERGDVSYLKGGIIINRCNDGVLSVEADLYLSCKEGVC